MPVPLLSAAIRSQLVRKCLIDKQFSYQIVNMFRFNNCSVGKIKARIEQEVKDQIFGRAYNTIKPRIVLGQTLPELQTQGMGYNANCYYQNCYYNCCNYYGYCASSYYNCYWYYQDQANSGLSAGAIAAAAIGSIIVVALVVFIACYCYRRRQQRRQEEEIRRQNLTRPNLNAVPLEGYGPRPQFYVQPYAQQNINVPSPYGQPVNKPAMGHPVYYPQNDAFAN